MRGLVLMGILLLVSSCANRDKYYDAVNQQNMTIQLQNAKQEEQKRYEREVRERRRQEHNLLMANLAIKMTEGAAKTATPVDDIMGPILFMVMEDKFATAEFIASLQQNSNKVNVQPLQTIEPPADGVDYLRAATPYAGMVLTGVLGWKSYDAMTDLAATAGNQYLLSGENNKMNVDSFKSGSNNTVNAGGDSTITGSDTVEGNCQTGDCGEETDPTNPTESEMCTGPMPSLPIVRTDPDGTTWVSNGCSCSSYQAQHAGCENP
ncbi:MAG: hypothetical protein DRO67_01265 [Candidatus Asgardarchaeum californiense]|nr:MAG: hypothetical protein DRO67_01265 [Candidatus Asgardarchaeum californiense]